MTRGAKIGVAVGGAAVVVSAVAFYFHKKHQHVGDWFDAQGNLHLANGQVVTGGTSFGPAPVGNM